MIAAILDKNNFPAFRFDTPLFPAIGHPRAAEYFMTVVLHQFGFWELEGSKWSRSMYAKIDGETLKGSDFVWRSATKALNEGKEVLTEFLDDSGSSPLPMLKEHNRFSKGFAKFLAEHGAQNILEKCNSSDEPLITLLDIFSTAPGYMEDPLKKKVMLLAMTLVNRPEEFLKPQSDKELAGWGPVVDYHIQRTSLRSGIVVINDATLRAKIEAREVLEENEEEGIRQATFDAMWELSNASGLSHAAIDFLFFQARSRCPEASEPQCPSCPLDAVCAKSKNLFQPVFRTTYY